MPGQEGAAIALQPRNPYRLMPTGPADCLHATALLHAAAATVILSNLNLAVRQQASMLTDASAVVHPQQLFQELRQHSRLLSRPRFLTALQNEQLALAKHVSAGRCLQPTSCLHHLASQKSTNCRLFTALAAACVHAATD